MKKISLLFSLVLLFVLTAALTMVYINGFAGILISVFSACIAAIFMYFAAATMLQELNERSNGQNQAIQKMQTVYSDSIHETTTMITQLMDQLLKKQAVQNEGILTAINAVDVNFSDIIAALSKSQEEQNQGLINQMQAIDSNNTQYYSDIKNANQAIVDQILNAIQELFKGVENSSSSITKQMITQSEKQSAENTELINRICAMYSHIIDNQDGDNKLLAEIRDLAEDGNSTAISNSDKTIKKIELLIGKYKESNESISDAAEEMEDALEKLKESLSSNNDLLRKALERFMTEYDRISNMDAQLVEKVLSKK